MPSSGSLSAEVPPSSTFRRRAASGGLAGWRSVGPGWERRQGVSESYKSLSSLPDSALYLLIALLPCTRGPSCKPLFDERRQPSARPDRPRGAEAAVQDPARSSGPWDERAEHDRLWPARRRQDGSAAGVREHRGRLGMDCARPHRDPLGHRLSCRARRRRLPGAAASRPSPCARRPAENLHPPAERLQGRREHRGQRRVLVRPERGRRLAQATSSAT